MSAAGSALILVPPQVLTRDDVPLVSLAVYTVQINGALYHSAVSPEYAL